MKNKLEMVAVCSRSFSKNTYLRQRLCSRYEHVKFNDLGESLAGDQLVRFLQGYQKAIVGLETLNESTLKQLPNLKVVSKYGVGLDSIDLSAMETLGIKLGWKRGVNARSVAELVLASSILLLRNLIQANHAVREGRWQQQTGMQLSHKTVGIVGCGAIGQDLVLLLEPFQCTVLVYDIRDYPEFFAKHQIHRCSLDHLLRTADLISIHLPLDESTRDLFSEARLKQIKKGSILLNAARGGIVDEGALKKLLQTGQIAAAAFDVFRQEPPSDTELLNLRNFFVTPHVGGSAMEAINAMGEAAIEGLEVNVNPSKLLLSE